MPSQASLDAAIDRLYQLPPEQFTSARAELAKQAGKSEAAAVRALQKPNLVAWALNQLYWTSRPVFDRLVAAAARLRSAQAEALMGRPSDVRSADENHRKALGAAIEETRAILAHAGHESSPDALRVLAAALQALPWRERPGRLVRPPAPSGFEALAGLPFDESLRTAAEATGATEAPQAPPSEPAHGKPKGRQPGARATAGQREAERRQEARVEEARRRVEQARRELMAAVSGLRDTEERVAAARAAEGRAREAEERAREAARRAREEWEQARAKMAEADAGHREAARRHTVAERALAAAERSLR